MTKLTLGTICGIVFAILDVCLMIPLELPDKKTAMAGAFASRFAIGFLIGASSLPLPHWIAGLVVALLISLPDAIITQAWLPILVVGGIGGVVIGLVVGKWGK